MNNYYDDIPNGVGEAALSLHQNKSTELTIRVDEEHSADCIETDDFSLNNGQLRFVSLEARNRVAAIHLYQQHKPGISDPHEWVELAIRTHRDERRSDDSVAARLLGLIHDRDDVFELAASAVTEWPRKVFAVLHVVGAALPHIRQWQAASLVTLIHAHYELTRNDLAQGMFLGQIQTWLSGQPDGARTVVARLRNAPEVETVSLYFVALISIAAGGYIQEAIAIAEEDAASPDPLLREKALRGLGRILQAEDIGEPEATRATRLILSYLCNDDQRDKSAAIRAAADALHATRTFDPALVKLAENENIDTLIFVCSAMCRHRQSLADAGVIELFLPCFHAIPSEHDAAVQELDRLLADLLSTKAYRRLAIACFTAWAARNVHGSTSARELSSLFPNLCIELAEQPELLDSIVTDWLLADEDGLGYASANLLGEMTIRDVRHAQLDRSRLDSCDREDLIYLIRRILGFQSHQNVIISLCFSLLSTQEAKTRVAGTLGQVVLNELAEDFPAATIEALESRRDAATDEDWRAYFSKLTDRVQARFDGLDALPVLPELQPPRDLIWRIQKMRDKQIATAMDKAQEASIVSLIATEVPLKAGLGWFAHQGEEYTTPSPLQAHSHSWPFPRRAALDEIGYELSRLQFRIAKRGD